MVSGLLRPLKLNDSHRGAIGDFTYLSISHPHIWGVGGNPGLWSEPYIDRCWWLTMDKMLIDGDANNAQNDANRQCSWARFTTLQTINSYMFHYFPVFSHVFLYFLMFSYIFQCFPIFSIICRCFPCFHWFPYVFPCFFPCHPLPRPWCPPSASTRTFTTGSGAVSLHGATTVAPWRRRSTNLEETVGINSGLIVIWSHTGVDGEDDDYPLVMTNSLPWYLPSGFIVI